MSIRRAKQIIYGAFYMVIWIFVVWGIMEIFFHPVPPAPPQPAAAAQAISVLSTNEFTSAPGYATFLAKIANTNANLGAQYFGFSFDLIDASGTVIQSFPGGSFVYPNQVKYIALVNQPVATNAGPVQNFVLSVSTSTTEWVASSSFGAPPALAVLNVETNITSSTAVATGELTDNDTATFNNVFIIAVFKDGNGNPVGTSQTEFDSIAPNQTEDFSISYPAIPGINPAATEVAAYAER